MIREVRLIELPKKRLHLRGPAAVIAACNINVGFGEGGWGVAEQMIAARYLMYTGLYFHKTKRIYEIHLTQFLPYALKAFGGRLPDDVRSYVGLSDSVVWRNIVVAANGT